MSGTLIGIRKFPSGGRFEVVVGDLLAETTDAIVNAANGALAHGGGVAAAIERAAGGALTAEGDALVRERGAVPTGEAVVTTAGRLPFKGVIHAVGPRMGEGDEETKLVSALVNAFLRAHERGWTSVSFPAVSSGVFRVPHDLCVRAYLRAVREFYSRHPDTGVKLVRLVLLPGPLLEAVRRELDLRS